jgi:hypothetical protein
MDDGHTVHSILKALYETISGPAVEERDWRRFAALLFPGARLICTSIAADGIPRSTGNDRAILKIDGC